MESGNFLIRGSGLNVDREDGARTLKTASIATSALMQGYSSGVFTASDWPESHRRIGFQARWAMRKLRHAIEYLTGESLHEGVSISMDDEHIQANLILMACNRQIYFECPITPSLGERLRPILASFWIRDRA